MASDEWISASTPYVAPRRKGESDAWTQESAARAVTGGQKLTFAGEAPAPAEVADAFGIGEGDTVVARKRVITLDGDPIELTDTYYPAAIAAGTPLATPRKIKGGAVTLLSELGHTAEHIHEAVTARMATEPEREALHLGDRDPVLTLSRIASDSEGDPIQVDLITMPARGRHLHYKLKVNR
ncbi:MULTISPECIES: UTRA domain-containing protein [unclassified Streptomyces]|uniref:GntR family transcriptional regulator n=1 Tax=unclassified Streptomyces TaxID=2593676 RepID=UPI00136B0241|nr:MULTISPECIES: UTRA domain-containing protein [unclassified Streptomyces]NDZ98538.1 UTRA domain-containing protein [Streptomyces sp. SID10116]MYY79736.1 UTRA domain-containing protein [Streptomyces sp. SID335]MYZ16560.1 UTRA domain-containing protein [Streptomyces sp. SID337]NDZ84527.1 UTRA domain-containing protein [Streptomyces sp. SID10115]NEB43490.1 UTRA domain-containing protein [Streptomyces sp. SID339]